MFVELLRERHNFIPITMCLLTPPHLHVGRVIISILMYQVRKLRHRGFEKPAISTQPHRLDWKFSWYLYLQQQQKHQSSFQR